MTGKLFVVATPSHWPLLSSPKQHENFINLERNTLHNTNLEEEIKSLLCKNTNKQYSKVTQMHSYQKFYYFILFRLSTAWHMDSNDSLTHIGIFNGFKSSESRVRNTFVQTADNNIPVRSKYHGVANNDSTIINS